VEDKAFDNKPENILIEFTPAVVSTEWKKLDNQEGETPRCENRMTTRSCATAVSAVRPRIERPLPRLTQPRHTGKNVDSLVW